jgi:hypothetical protein
MFENLFIMFFLQANETNFYPGEPDDYKNGQECIQIVGGRRDYTGSWDDGNCSIQQGFICEKNAGEYDVSHVFL